jgi:hypothetical protein
MNWREDRDLMLNFGFGLVECRIGDSLPMLVTSKKCCRYKLPGTVERKTSRWFNPEV